MFLVLFDQLNYFDSSVVSGCSLMDENYDLLAHVEDTDQVREYDIVHHIVPSLSVAKLFDTIKGTF